MRIVPLAASAAALAVSTPPQHAAHQHAARARLRAGRELRRLREPDRHRAVRRLVGRLAGLLRRGHRHRRPDRGALGSTSVRVDGAAGYCNHVFVRNTRMLAAATGSALHVRYWVRHTTALPAAHVTMAGLQDTADGSRDQWLNRIYRPRLADLKLGWESYGEGADTLWYDDVAVGSTRLNC